MATYALPGCASCCAQAVSQICCGSTYPNTNETYYCASGTSFYWFTRIPTLDYPYDLFSGPWFLAAENMSGVNSFGINNPPTSCTYTAFNMQQGRLASMVLTVNPTSLLLSYTSDGVNVAKYSYTLPSGQLWNCNAPNTLIASDDYAPLPSQITLFNSTLPCSGCTDSFGQLTYAPFDFLSDAPNTTGERLVAAGKCFWQGYNYTFLFVSGAPITPRSQLTFNQAIAGAWALGILGCTLPSYQQLLYTSSDFQAAIGGTFVRPASLPPGGSCPQPLTSYPPQIKLTTRNSNFRDCFPVGCPDRGVSLSDPQNLYATISNYQGTTVCGDPTGTYTLTRLPQFPLGWGYIFQSDPQASTQRILVISLVIGKNFSIATPDAWSVNVISSVTINSAFGSSSFVCVNPNCTTYTQTFISSSCVPFQIVRQINSTCPVTGNVSFLITITT